MSKHAKIIISHDVLEPWKQAHLASRDVIASSQVAAWTCRGFFALGDGCWLPSDILIQFIECQIWRLTDLLPTFWLIISVLAQFYSKNAPQKVHQNLVHFLRFVFPLNLLHFPEKAKKCCFSFETGPTCRQQIGLKAQISCPSLTANVPKTPIVWEGGQWRTPQTSRWWTWRKEDVSRQTWIDATVVFKRDCVLFTLHA